MNQAITDRLELFCSNNHIARDDFAWRIGAEIRRLISLVYALDDKPLDSEAIKDCHGIIKGSTRAFSSFRGIASYCIAAKLSLQDEPKNLFDDTLAAYDRLRDAKFAKSDQLAVAAYILASSAEKFNFKKIADKAGQYRDGLRGRLWFLSGIDDSVFSVLLALSGGTPAQGIQRIEELNGRLRPEFKWQSRATVQSLSQVLALGGKSDDALNCLLDLNTALRAHKIRLDRPYTLPALRILSLLPVDKSVIVTDLIDAQTFLRRQSGFKTVSSSELLLYATAIVASTYADDSSGTLAASAAVSTINIIIGQQIAVMIAAMIASSAAASAAASASA